MSNLPDRPDSSPKLPVRKLSNRDFELVIRRAAELQARQSEEAFGGDGISEAEVIRIGRELGLSPENLQRAIAETSGEEPEEGMLHSLFGAATVRASRLIAGDAEKVSRTLERYLVEREFLAVQRRFGDRTLFTRATGMIASMGRATSQMFSRSPLLKVDNLEVSFRPLDESGCWLSLASSLRANRTAAAATSFVAGGSGAAVAGAVLGIALAPPAALIALPILGASVFGARAYYDHLTKDVEVQLESLLDRLEHGELLAPSRGAWGK